MPAVIATPPVVVVHDAIGSAGSASVTLENTGSAAVTVGELTPDATCAPAVTTSAALPLAIPAAGSRPVALACAASPIPTIARCRFHARTAAHAPIADYTALCLTSSALALSLSPASAAFGDVVLGTQRTLPVTLTNTGSDAIDAVAIDVADQTGAFVIGAPCPTDGPACATSVPIPAGGSLAFDLRCRPLALGTQSTSVYVVASNGGTAGPYPVSCNGVAGASGPSIAADVPSVAVGDVPVGAPAVLAVVDVTNLGTSDLHVASIATVGGATTDWTFVSSSPCASLPCALPAGASFQVEVAFTPGALFPRHSELQIKSDDALHPTLAIPLDGSGTGPTLALDESAATPVDLGAVTVGSTSQLVLALRNDGNTPLPTASLTLSEPDGADAITVDPPALAIDPGTTAAFTVTCTPAARGDFAATLTVAAPAAVRGSPISLSIACSGVGGDLVSTPEPVAFGEVRTGTGPVTQTVTLSTLGPALTISDGPTLATPLAGVTLGALSQTAVTAADPATFTVTVDPQTDLALADRIDVTAGGATIEIPLAGAVVTAAVTASGGHDLGSFCIGEPTVASTVSLAATGTASVGLLAPPVLAAGDASPFELAVVSPSVFPSRLRPGGRAFAEVTPRRQGSAGTVTDAVVWSDDVPDAPAPSTTVQARFIADGGAVSPGSIEFGTQPIHVGIPTDQSITIQNCGTEAMTLATPTISPSGAFYTLGALPAQLLPGQAASLDVGFAPVATGDFASTLSIAATTGTTMLDLEVALHGVGDIDTPPGGADAGTGGNGGDGGGCGCQSDPGLAAGSPSLLVGILLLRRRRRGPAVP